MTYSPEEPTAPLTPDELAALRPGVDIAALQEVIAWRPQMRKLFLAYLSAEDRTSKLLHAAETLSVELGIPPEVPTDEEIAATEAAIEAVRPRQPDGDTHGATLAFLPEPHTDFHMTIDCGGDQRLQQLVFRALGIRSSDA